MLRLAEQFLVLMDIATQPSQHPLNIGISCVPHLPNIYEVPLGNCGSITTCKPTILKIRIQILL